MSLLYPSVGFLCQTQDQRLESGVIRGRPGAQLLLRRSFQAYQLAMPHGLRREQHRLWRSRA